MISVRSNASNDVKKKINNLTERSVIKLSTQRTRSCCTPSRTSLDSKRLRLTLLYIRRLDIHQERTCHSAFLPCLLRPVPENRHCVRRRPPSPASILPVVQTSGPFQAIRYQKTSCPLHPCSECLAALSPYAHPPPSSPASPASE